MEPQCRDAFYHEATIEDVPYPRMLFGYELIAKTDGKWMTAIVSLAALEDH